jgi:hypothetical protein
MVGAVDRVRLRVGGTSTLVLLSDKSGSSKKLSRRSFMGLVYSHQARYFLIAKLNLPEPKLLFGVKGIRCSDIRRLDLFLAHLFSGCTLRGVRFANHGQSKGEWPTRDATYGAHNIEGGR